MQAFQPLPRSSARFIGCSLTSFIKPLSLLCSAAVVLAALLIARALLCLVHILASQVPVSELLPPRRHDEWLGCRSSALHAVKRLLTFFAIALQLVKDVASVLQRFGAMQSRLCLVRTIGFTQRQRSLFAQHANVCSIFTRSTC